MSGSHNARAIPDAVKEVTHLAEEDESKWMYHRIIVTTTSQAGVVFRHNISPSHFTHVFLDEAAQCWEPESLIPISLTAISHGCIVLAGDHYQLGPVCMSHKARDYGLKTSLMERLMLLNPYERNDEFAKYGSYNPKFVTKLVTNYRSVTDIMCVSSELFYENELICVNNVDKQLIEMMGFKKPIVFTGIRGELLSLFDYR